MLLQPGCLLLVPPSQNYLQTRVVGMARGGGGREPFFIDERQAVPSQCAICCSAEGWHRTYTSCQPCLKVIYFGNGSCAGTLSRDEYQSECRPLLAGHPAQKNQTLCFYEPLQCNSFHCLIRIICVVLFLSERNFIFPISASLLPQYHFFILLTF